MATRIKGASIINTIAILREVLGAARFQAVLQACPQETQQLIRRTLVAVEWVPLEQWSPFMNAIFEQACRKDEHQYRRLLRAVCKRDFTTVYRVYLNTPTPQVVLDKSPSIWSAYFDTGTLTIGTTQNVLGRERITLEMRGLETTNPIHAITMQAYFEQLMLMAGAQQCSVQRTREEIRDGKISCDYIVEYAK